jgi:hypothetical protein
MFFQHQYLPFDSSDLLRDNDMLYAKELDGPAQTILDISQRRVEIISPTHGSATLYSATPEMHKFLCILDG